MPQPHQLFSFSIINLPDTADDIALEESIRHIDSVLDVGIDFSMYMIIVKAALTADPETIIHVIETHGLDVKLHQTTTENTPAFQEARARFFVESISCASCAAHIEHAIKTLDSIYHVDVNVSKKLVTVLFDPEKTNPEDIMHAANKAGYLMVPATGKYMSHHAIHDSYYRSTYRLTGAWLFLIASTVIAVFLNRDNDPVWQLLSFCLNVFIVFGCGKMTLLSAIEQLKNRRFSIDLLISISAIGLLAAGFYAPANALRFEPSILSAAIVTAYLTFCALRKKLNSSPMR